jgi:hypothetical protein
MGAFLQVVIGGVARTRSSRRFTGRRFDPRDSADTQSATRMPVRKSAIHTLNRARRACRRGIAVQVSHRSAGGLTQLSRARGVASRARGVLQRRIRGRNRAFRPKPGWQGTRRGYGPTDRAAPFNWSCAGASAALNIGPVRLDFDAASPAGFVSLTCHSVTRGRGTVGANQRGAGASGRRGSRAYRHEQRHRIRGSHTNDDGSLLRGLQWQTL